MTKRNNKCEDISVLLGEMVLGTLPKHDERVVEEHLLECAGCRNELKELRSFYGVIGEYRLPQPDPAFSKRMKAAVFREMQNQKQPRSERQDEKIPWYRRPKLVLAITTVTAVGLTAVLYVAISPYLAGLGSGPDFGEDIVAGGGVATLTETRLPYTSRSEEAVAPSFDDIEESSPEYLTERGEESHPGSPVGSLGESAMERRAIPDKYAYWESTLAGGGSAEDDGGAVASTTIIKRDSQTSTDFDEEYLKAMHRKAKSSGEGYAGGTSGERDVPGRWGSWSHPDVGIETTAIGGASGGGGYIPLEDDIYSTLLELSPEERERVLDELDDEADAIK